MRFLIFSILSLSFLFLSLSGRGQETVTPTLKLGQGDQVKCAGESVTFDLVFTGFGDITYELAWRKVGRPDTLSTSPELILNTLTTDSAGKYYCELWDITNSERYYSDTLTLTVNEYISGLPLQQEAVIGERVELAAALVAGVNYTWTTDAVHTVQSNKIIFPVIKAPVRDETVLLSATYKGCTFNTETVLHIARGAKKDLKPLLSGDAKACGGTSHTFRVSVPVEGSYTYSWYKVKETASLASGAEHIINTVAASDSGRYYCVVYDTDYDHTYYSDTLSLAVDDYVSGLPSDTTAVIGKDMVLTAASGEGVSYVWTANSAHTAQQNKITFSPVKAPARDEVVALTATYKGCTFSTSTTLHVTHEDREVEAVLDGPGKCCAGDSLTYTVTASGDSEYNYNWCKVGGASALSSASAYKIKNAVPGQSGKYYCVVYDPLYDLTYYSDTLELNVYAYPGTRLAVSSQTPCYKGEVELSAGYSIAGTGMNYRWEKDSRPMAGTMPSRTVRVEETNDVTYKVFISNNGCEDSAVTTLRPIVPLTGLTRHVPVSIGDPVTITAALQDGAAYAWKMKDEYTVNAEGNIVSFTASTKSDSVYLTTTFRGCTLSDTALLVKSHADIKVDVKAYGYTRVCAGDSLNYYVTVSEESQYAYTWYKLGQGVVGNDKNYTLKSITVGNAGRYYCKVYDQLFDLTFYSDTLEVNVSTYPELSVRANGKTPVNNKWIFCRGTEVDLEITNAAGQPGVKYLWTGKGIFGNPGDRSVKIQVKDSSVYKALITNNGCVREDTFSIVSDFPEIRLPERVYGIVGENMTLSAIGGKDSYTFSWTSVGGASSVTSSYTFPVQSGVTKVVAEATDALHCKDSDTCYVEGLAAMNYETSLNDGYVVSRDGLQILQEDTAICARSPLQLEVQYTGYDGYTYEWMKVNTATPIDTGRVMNFASISDRDKGKYYCRVADLEKGGFLYSDTVEVKVNYRPKAQIVSPVSGEAFCAGIDIPFTGKDAQLPSSSNVYEWKGAGIKSGANSTNLTATVSTNGYYTFTVTYGTCSDTAEVLISPAIRKVDIPSDMILSQPSDAVAFTASTAKGGANFSWFVNGMEQVTASASPGASLSIDRAGEVVVKMEQGGCNYYDTCRIFMRSFTPVAESPDDGFAVSCPVLRVTDKELNVCADGEAVLGVVYLGYDRYKYEWRKVGSNTVLSDSITYVIHDVTVAHSGEYYCRAFNPDLNEYIFSDTLTLKVKEGPVARISTPVDGARVCYGSEIVLKTNTAYAPGGSSSLPDVADRLVWEGEGIIGGQGTGELHVRVGNNGVYTLKAIKNDGCSSEVSIRLNVVKPSIDIPYVYYRNEGSDIPFTAKRDLMNLNVEWFVNGTLAATDKGEVLLHITEDASVIARLTTDEHCVAEDTCRVFIKDATTFKSTLNDGFIISRPRPRIPSEMKYVNVCPDSLITLRVNHAEYPYFKYEWHKVGETEVLAKGREYTFAARGEHTGFYYCTVVDSDYPADSSFMYSDTMRLTVYNGPVAQISASVNGEIYPGREICPGTRLLLDAGLSASGAGGNIVYQWFEEERLMEGETSHSVEVVPERSTTYIVKVGNGECADTAMIRFEVNAPVLELPGRIQLSAPVADYALDIQIPEGMTVAWSFRPEGGSETAGNGNKLNLTGDGWIYARCTRDECQGIDSCRVFVKNEHTFRGGENDGFHILESSTTVWIEPRMEEQVLCMDNRLELTAHVRGFGKYTYLWYRIIGDRTYPMEDEREALLSIDKMDEVKAGKFFCEVTDVKDMGSGKIVYYTDTITVSMKNGPVARIDFVNGDAKPTACFGDEFELVGSNANATIGEGQLSYAWSGDVFSKMGDDKHIIARPQTTGTYVLEVKDIVSGCTDTVPLYFKMNSPKVDIPGNIYKYAPGNVEITAKTEGAGDLKWYIDYRSQVKGEGNPVVLPITQDALVIAEFLQNGCSGFDTTRVFVKWPTTFAGGDDDGYVMSALALRATVHPQFLNVCRGTDIEVGLNVNVEGRSLKYQWMKVGSAIPVSYKKDLVLRANKMADAGKYYCLITDPAEENMQKRTINSDTATVTMLNGPIAKITSPADGEQVCDGVAIQIDASGTERDKVSDNDQYIYEWFGSGISFTGLQYVVNVRANEDSRYIVKASLGECATYDTVDLRVFRPEVSIPPVMFLSDAKELEFGVADSQKGNIQWYLYYDANPSVQEYYHAGDSAKFLVEEDARIIVERQQSDGKNICRGYDTCRVFVKDIRSFQGKDEDGFMSAGTSFYIKIPEFTDNVCVGDTAVMYVKVVGNDFYHYEWKKSGDDRVYSNSSLCKIQPVTKADEGYYYCVITDVNNNYSQTSSRIFLTVKEKPESKIIANQTVICYGSEVSLEADKSKLKPEVNYTYFWQGNGVKNNISSSTMIRPEKSGDYILAVGDGDCFVSDTISVTVQRARIELPLVYHVKSGDDLTLKAKLNGGVSALDWKVDGVPYRNTPEVALKNLTKSAGFTVQTTGACQVTQAGQIYVRDNATYSGGYDDGFTMPNSLPKLLDQCDILLGCNVDTAVLWVTAMDTKKLTFVWQKYDEVAKRFDDYQPVVGRNNVTGFRTDTMKFSSIFPDDEGRYRCCLINTFGYTYSREIRLVKGGTPEIQVRLKDGSVCENNLFSLGVTVKIPHEGTTTGLKYNWYFAKDGINFSQILPVEDYNHPAFSMSKPLEKNEGYYMVEVSNFCGAVFDTAFQDIWEAPTFVEQPSNQAVCINGSIEFTTAVKGGGDYVYQLWQVELDAKGKFKQNKRLLYAGVAPATSISVAAKSDEGDYMWKVWNECDSVRSNPFRLSVEDEIVPLFVGVDTVVCAGTNLVLWANTNIANNPLPTTLKYYWEKDGAKIAGSTLNRHTISSIKPTDAGLYTCYAYHSCTPRAIKQFKVKTKGVPVITLPVKLDQTAYCEGTKALKMRIDYTSDAGEVTCAWYYNSNRELFDGGRLSGTHTALFTIDSLIASDAGNYNVVLKNMCGRTSSNSVKLDVHLPARFPAASLLKDTVRLCAGETTTLKATANGEPPIIYTWLKNGAEVQRGTNAALRLDNVTHSSAGNYLCVAANSCNIDEGARTSTYVDIMTPLMYELQINGEKKIVGHYCGSDGVNITLSGFEKRAVYTLYRRSSASETDYVAVKVVRGDTVSTPILSFGYMGYGLYHVVAVNRTKDCSVQMKNEVTVIRDATPEQFDFYVSDPMCTGEYYGILKLSGSENNPEIEYRPEVYYGKDDDGEDLWGGYGGTFNGNGQGNEWITPPGVYRIMATNVISGCEVQIGHNDTIAERPYPNEYRLYPEGGDTTACFGMESDVVLVLSGSEKTCTYTLYKDGVSTERERSGNLISWDTVRGGVYHVMAETNYGCKKEMGNVEITDLEPLKQFIFSNTSSIVYCEEDEGNGHMIVLEGSTPGIRYDFYSAAYDTPHSQTWGTGGHLSWNVQLAGDSTYYVVAVDTFEGCYREMANRVDIQANHLQIAVESPIKVASSTQANLKVDISNPMGTPVVDWQPAGRIVNVDPVTHTATTEILESGDRFMVTVSDDYCTKEAFIDLSVTGEVLKAEIRASDCYTPLDTIFVCEGDKVSLCSFLRGGSGVYRFKWSDDLTDSIPVAQSSKLVYDKAADGYVVLYVESDVLQEGELITKKATDTVRVVFHKRPVLLNSDNGSLTCVIPGENAELNLKALEAGVEYRLEHKIDGTGKFELVAGSEHIGSGNDTTYTIPYSGTVAGEYRVVADKNYGSSVCSRTFTLTELRQAPQHFSIRSQGSTEYCADRNVDSIYLENTERDVTYRLLRDKRQIAQLKGNGGEMLFSGMYNSDAYGKHTYTVVAVIDRCVDTLENSVEITSYERPVIASITGMRDYCLSSGESPVEVTIPVPVQSVMYSLYKLGETDPVIEEAASVDPIEFKGGVMNTLTAGKYYVIARAKNGVGGKVVCTDTAFGLAMIEEPDELAMLDSKMGYCDNLQGYDGKMFMTGADALIRYELFDGPKEVARTSLGYFTTWKDDTIYYDGTISVPQGQNIGEYYVYANAGKCSKDFGPYRIEKYTAPLDCQLRGELLGCIGYELPMGVQSAEIGVTYTLFRETAGVIDSLSTESGTGGHISFGSYKTEGVYYVVAKKDNGGCSRKLTQEYRIRPLPDFYKIYTPKKSAYCEGERGIQIGITGTQEKVTYFLQTLVTDKGEEKWADVTGGKLMGTGSGAQLFSGYFKTGKYRITTDYCALTMLDTLDVSELPLPEPVNIDIEGKACVDSVMKIVVLNPENGTKYALKYEQLPSGLDTLAGTAVSWQIAAAQNGAYTVVADRAGCQATLTPAIKPGEAVSFGELRGMEAGLCAEEKRDLYLASDEWDTKARYALRIEGVDTATYIGKAVEGKLVFGDVPAGHNYYVVASHLSCETEKGAYRFDGIELPVIGEDDFIVEDCKPDGEASVTLKNLSVDYKYILSGLMKVDTVKEFRGDTVIGHLNTGSYTYRMQDTRTGCYSLPLDRVIRRAVPADSIISLLTYCDGNEGVTINLSGQTFGVDYTLKHTTGEVIEKMTSSTAFRSVLAAGRYVYYRERTGLWGGCWLADTFEVEKYPIPSNSLIVETPKTLCELGTNIITIKNSEVNVDYMLQNAVTRLYIDTIRGNGGVISFTERKPKGTYNIIMRYKGLCEAAPYYKSFSVNPVPPQAIVSDSRFCAEPGVAGKAQLDIKGLDREAEYVLYNTLGTALDTLYGMNAGYFEKQPAGNYFVIATYQATGCSDKVAEMSIREVTRPKVFPVSNAAGNGLCEDLADVRLKNGCEGDSVKYYLYMNDYFKLAGPVTAVNGEVKFGTFREVGAYKIYAEKGDGTCGAWMDGSVIIYAAPSNARLSVTGIDCSGGEGGDVIVSASKTVRDWQYYISDGNLVSDKKLGAEDEMLSWDLIGGKKIPAGKYILYAINACDTIIAMDTVDVKSAVKPAVQHLKRTQEGVFCNGEQFELRLESSQKGVKYTLVNGADKWEVDGTGSGDGLFMQSVNVSGLYTVYATVDSTACTYFADTLTISQDMRPEPTGVEGDSKCAMGTDTTIIIKLKKTRYPKTNYFLEVNGHYVDTILNDAAPNQKAFKPQSEAGCYTVVAASPTRYCDTREETGCLSRPPRPETGLVGGKRQVDLCDGDVLPVQVESSEIGVSYVLLDQEGSFCHQPVQGNGGLLTVGSIKEAGRYSVTAFVSQGCSVSLEDTVTVSILPRPLLNVQKYHSYAQGTPGVKLSVAAETSEEVTYVLANALTNSSIDWKTAVGGKPVEYDGYFKAGTYMIYTLEDTGNPPFACVSRDTVVVEEISLTPFRLEIMGTPFKCETSECRQLKLSGSEKGTTYSLYHRSGERTDFVALAEGTGKAIEWGSQCDTGYFYVMAEKRLGDGQLCQAKMGAEVHIYVSTIIEKYRLIGKVVGYCSNSDPAGEVVLDSSQSNAITYKLYCNGRPVPGKEIKGKGGSKLLWDKLEGLECIENNDVGNVYTVRATDGNCEVQMAGSVNVIRTNNVSIRNQAQSFRACTGLSADVWVYAHGCMLSYEWKHNGEIVSTDAGYHIDSVRLEDMGTYTCKVSNYCGSLMADPIDMSVQKVVTMPEYMQDKLVCGSEAQDIQLVSKAVGENYAWFRVGSNDTISRERILEIKNATAEKDAGEYWCNTWNECGGLADTVRLEFNRIPQVSGYTYSVDTLCKGAPFSLSINSRDSLVWYLNDVEIRGKHDGRLNIGALELTDEGAYKVKAVNICQERYFDLVKLLVDDTIKIISAPEADKHYCENSKITLQLKTEPSNRVSYTWYKRMSLKGTGDTYIIPQANYTLEDGAWYYVQYHNKCSAGEVSQTVHIDRPIVLKAMTTPDITCADGTDKLIIVKDNAQVLPEYNQYKWYRRTSGEPQLISESDTLKVKRDLKNRGQYYAVVANTCKTVTSPDVDLRIDTVPVIKEQLKGVSVCESNSAVFSIAAAGGDITYSWYLKKKNGNETYNFFKKEEFSSTAKWTLDRLAVDYDSAKVWCVVSNDCGYALSDTVLLRVTQNIRLTTNKKTAALCANAADEVKIAVVPNPQLTDYWDYYVEKDGVVIHNPKSVFGTYTDTIIVKEPGKYRFYGFETKATGCVSDTSSATVVVSNREIAEAHLTAYGKTTVCRSEKVQMRLQIQKGKAPWKIDIRRKSDNVTAPELGGEMITVYSRDTILELTALNNETFYIASASQFLDADACAGNVSGEVAIVVQPVIEAILDRGRDKFGECEVIDLVNIFKPSADASAGKFYIGGKLVANNKFGGKPGNYELVYKTLTSAGCVDSTVRMIHIDSLPKAKFYADQTDLCSKEITNIHAEFYGTGAFNYQIGVYSYDTLGHTGRPSLLRGTASEVSYPISFDEEKPGGNNTSMRMYHLASLIDGYGCAAFPVSADSLKIFMHRSPTYNVKGKHASYGTGFTDAVTHFEVPATNKRVWFMVTKTSGTAPWSFQITRVAPDGTQQPPFENKQLTDPFVSWATEEAGTYLFTMSDAHCKAREIDVRTISHLDTGYIRVKAVLEGAYNKEKQCMVSPVFENGLVPLKKWKQWPVAAMGSRKGIDWVTVELRKNGVNGQTIFSEQFLLLSDGSIVDKAGRETLPIPNIDFDTEFYVVVKHRNHLAVGSYNAYKLKPSIGTEPLVDLRQYNYIYRNKGDITSHMTFLGLVNSVTLFAMPSGNVLLNSLISIENANIAIMKEMYTPAYYDLDVNLDGVVSLPAILSVPDPDGGDDVSDIYKNRNKYSEIKE